MTGDEGSIRYEGWRVAAASFIGVFFASMAAYGFAVLFGPLAQEFAWSRETVSTAYSCLSLASALAAPLLGGLLDRYGAVRVALPCMIATGLVIASLSTMTGSPTQLFLLFTALGLSVTGISPVAFSRAVSSWFVNRRGAALALVMAGGAVGSIAHPPAVDALISVAGWRTACVIMGGLLLAVGVPLVTRFVRERHGRAATPAAVTSGATPGEALRSWIFWTLIVVVAGAAIAFNGVVVHIVVLLIDRGVAPRSAAMALSVMGAAGLAGRLITGWLIDRFRATYVSAALLTLAAAGILVLASSASFMTGLLAAAMIGFGMGGELDVTPFLLSRYFGLRSLATLYGVCWMASGGGAALGSVGMGRAFDTSGSYDGVLLTLAGEVLFVALLMLALPRYGLPRWPLLRGDQIEAEVVVAD